MIFKNNVKLSEEETLLVKALLQMGFVNEFLAELDEYKEDVSKGLNSIKAKLKSDNNLEDLQYELLNLKSIIEKKSKFVEKQEYEEAARKRDEEKQSYKKLNLGSYFPNSLYLKDIITFLEEYKTYLIFKSVVISESSNINLLIQPGTASKNEIGELLFELSTLYKMLGGSGITFKLDEIRNLKYRFDYE